MCLCMYIYACMYVSMCVNINESVVCMYACKNSISFPPVPECFQL